MSTIAMENSDGEASSATKPLDEDTLPGSTVVVLVNFSKSAVQVDARTWLNVPEQLVVYTASVGSNINSGSKIKTSSYVLPGTASVVLVSPHLLLSGSTVVLLVNFSNSAVQVDARTWLNIPEQLVVYTASVGSNINNGSKIKTSSYVLPGSASVILVSPNYGIASFGMEKELTEEKRVNGDAKLSPYWQIVNIAVPNCAASGSSDLHCTSTHGISHTS
uniref:Uncharacterized protein n=1 Tax=Vespula pensylvanica TaxID=30213 RepID=A0A834PB92_VESPE|nr:hypothetical protein H0235_002999 [Vespula pensylvanica]